MRKAKKRKQPQRQDRNRVKPFENYSGEIISLKYLAPQLYQKYGRGICVYRPGEDFRYLLESWLQPESVERIMLASYDPLTELLFCQPLAPGSDLFLTSNLELSSIDERDLNVTKNDDGNYSGCVLG